MDELMDQVASELLEGIEKKDKEMVCEAIKALVMAIQHEDQMQDEEEQ